MSSYLSNLLTTTTSRYNSLRRTLLSDEVDGDTEDDSHISRVLRAYYTEKGRQFPSWLPPDPKAPQPAPTQFATSSLRQPGQQQPGGRGGGLSDLWDTPSQEQPAQQPLSLRRGVQGRGMARGQPPRAGIVDSYNASEQQLQSRPLPSQRAGSYQSSFTRAQADTSPPTSSGGGASAQERLKARLWGSGRSNSPASSNNTSPSASPAPGASPYSRPGNASSKGRVAPYPDERGGYNSGSQSQSRYGDEGRGGAYDNDSSGYTAPRPQGQGRVGLPSGPRSYR
ncbi:hypothetical protein M501DRAFT_1015412 [Patellaria atrata CBS 101060]|uniref:Mso1 N-terminal domain-containing protein n=1 Tax=Patellaria atrata CBS 101060 TaxID=1346257 RepID=A0A9P4VP11_9PEZI|nr:hypothetical protein M501DRAFT_1015412 [Patellaria atrata CBS 101060]